jgi:hypothetical protein
MSKHSNAYLSIGSQSTRSSLYKLFRRLTRHASRIWNGNRRNFDRGASATARYDPDRLMLKAQALSRGDIAAPVSTEELKARGVKLQARIDAARVLLRGRGV